MFPEGPPEAFRDGASEDARLAEGPSLAVPGAPRVSEDGPLAVDISGATLIALENNPELAVERLSPSIRATFEEEEQADFDPVLGADASMERRRSEISAVSSITESTAAELSVSTLFPAGTEVELEAGTEVTDSSSSAATLAATRVGVSITQPLLGGVGSDVNLASLRQARLDTLASDYELRGFAEALVARVENTCWDYIRAERQIEIFTESLALANQQLSETRERISIGTLAEIELAAAQAEVARRREHLINADSALASTRLRLLRLLNPPGENIWQRTLSVADVPTVPDVTLDDVDAHESVALQMRPDLNQARLAIKRGEIELVKTRNGLLPKMDLFITLGKTGYSDSFADSIGEIDSDSYDTAFGVEIEYPWRNRAAAARHDRAVLRRHRAGEALRNLSQLVALDVRSACIEVTRTREQVAATAATRRLQQEALRGETEKFRVGKSTSFLVARAQRDLLISQIGEIAAVIGYRKALVDLYRLDGSLLVRRGINAPGLEPVSLEEPAASVKESPSPME